MFMCVVNKHTRKQEQRKRECRFGKDPLLCFVCNCRSIVPLLFSACTREKHAGFGTRKEHGQALVPLSFSFPLYDVLTMSLGSSLFRWATSTT